MGTLRIGMDARVSLNDGGQVIAAVEAALPMRPKLGDETLSVVLVPDPGLRHCRQIFADLARYAPRSPNSLALLFDQRGEVAQLAKRIMRQVSFFAVLTETEKSSISNRSTKLFTLSAISGAMQTLLAGMGVETLDEKVRLGTEFWIEVGKHIPAWHLAKEHKIATAELRRDYVHAHALALAAIARAGNQLLKNFRRNWKTKLKSLSTLDWSRANSVQWEGRAMNAGRLSKRNVNVILTGNVIKRHLSVPLSPDEQKLEREFEQGRAGRTELRGQRQ